VLSAWDRVLLKKLTVSYLVRETRCILWEPKVHYPPLYIQIPSTFSYPGSNQSSHSRSHPISTRSILLLSSHLYLDLPSGLLPLGFTTKALYVPTFYTIGAAFPTHPNLLAFLTRIIWAFDVGVTY